MTQPSHPAIKPLYLFALGVLLFCMGNIALAGPGAHGPNGEHLDSPSIRSAAPAQPRLEAQSDEFELVATLHASELSILVDRFKTNAPVLNAQLEVESAGIKAKAIFHADHGEYAVEDPAFLALLRKPAEHALVFTLIADKEGDLLDGTLNTSAGSEKSSAHDDHQHHAWEYAAWLTAILAGLGLATYLWLRQRRRHANQTLGSL